jgi:pseudaminic acid biosynthesis-associated methylase
MKIKRLESLWSGGFGDDYTGRNIAAGEGRRPFWKKVFARCKARSVLEVGCNAGANLRWIASLTDPRLVCGVDVNRKALETVRRTLPSVNALWSLARDLPFKDGCFDLTFTTGVLIHQPPADLPRVMGEIVRCSRRYVLCGEYYAETPEQILYRGHKGALFKRDFGALYRKLFPGLRLVDEGFLPRSRGGWDDVTYWLFEKKGRR